MKRSKATLLLSLILAAAASVYAQTDDPDAPKPICTHWWQCVCQTGGDPEPCAHAIPQNLITVTDVNNLVPLR